MVGESKNQKGFSATIVAFIILIGIIAGASWYVLSKKDDSSQKTSEVKKSEPSKSTVQQYVTIKAWNVRFATSKPLSQYTASSPKDRAGNQVVVITNSAQEAIHKGCGETLIERGAASSFYNPASDDLIAINQNVKKIGDYYYHLQSRQSACYDDDNSTKNADGTVNTNKSDEFEKRLTEAGDLTDVSLSNLTSL